MLANIIPAITTNINLENQSMSEAPSAATTQADYTIKRGAYMPWLAGAVTAPWPRR
jgi:hypothetical protein